VSHQEATAREDQRNSLLVRDPHPKFTTVEGKIGHEPAGAILHKDSDGPSSEGALRRVAKHDRPLLVIIIASCGHLDVHIDQGRGLSDLPMETGTRRSWHCREVDIEVAHRSGNVIE
jgi:hypothetical protein